MNGHERIYLRQIRSADKAAAVCLLNAQCGPSSVNHSSFLGRLGLPRETRRRERRRKERNEKEWQEEEEEEKME
jgi:hypothetical protein